MKGALYTLFIGGSVGGVVTLLPVVGAASVALAPLVVVGLIAGAVMQVIPAPSPPDIPGDKKK